MKYYGITECGQKFICNWINKSLHRDTIEGIVAKFLTMGLNDWCNSFIFSIFFIQFCIILNLYPNMNHFYKSHNATLIMNCIVHGRAQPKWIRAQSRRQNGVLIQRSGEVIQNEGANINRGLQNIVLTKIRLGGKRQDGEEEKHSDEVSGYSSSGRYSAPTPEFQLPRL